MKIPTKNHTECFSVKNSQINATNKFEWIFAPSQNCRDKYYKGRAESLFFFCVHFV